MKSLRSILGMAGLVLLALALNLLVWRQQLFSLEVALPFAGALVCGVIWLIAVFSAAAGRTALEGRTVGGIYAVVSSVLFLGICMVLYAFFSAWDVSWDLTQEGRRELSKQTVQVLQSMTEEVQVICFFLDVDEELVLIARDKTLRFVEQCQRYTELLKLEVLDPQVDRTRLEALNITHASTQGTIVVRSGARQRVITLSGGSPRLEERDFTNALINVLRNTQPKVCFLTGHHERDVLDEDEETGASMLGNLLGGEAYEVERIAIKISAPEIPPSCDILVINNPQSDLHPAELEAIETFMDRGGRLLILIDPWRKVNQGLHGKEVLRPWLEARYGIAVGFDIVITDQRENIWEAELSLENGPFEGIDKGFMEYRGSFHADHAITRGFDQVMLLAANRSVQAVETAPEGVIVTELLRTTPDFWAETDVAKLADTGQAQKNTGEVTGPISLAAAAVAPLAADKQQPNGPRDARLVVIGDSDFASNAKLAIAGHLNFMLNTFAWLSENEDLIAIRPTGKEDPPLVLSQKQQRAVIWISSLFTVQVIVLAGLVAFWLRRKHQ